ncbi:hypothetical protein N866_03445 [Actinotalea ferrariae CF5-4]|uniref:DUF4244 domain-containing protein n=1 Tax=Actinotalea ferrariae CF5-4 TaxID=948458 RepID=A0A021VPE9_9CELL|nr:hypothetical protein N866_03445 [Actinotalea ferrariae CF5-4]
MAGPEGTGASVEAADVPAEQSGPTAPVPPLRLRSPRLRGGRRARARLVVADPRGSRWDDAGMATAEYAIATVAAAGFAGLLITILRSDEVRGLLLGIVRGALST